MNESPKRGLLAAYRRLLGPLIRILIRNGISFSEFSQVAKEAYVEVATKDFRVKSGTISSSRIAVLAGLSLETVEKEKKELEKETRDSNLDAIADVLFGWHTDSDFVGPYGMPLELQLSQLEHTNLSSENSIDFRELVRRHVGNTDPIPLLKELLDIGAVIETEKGWFKALIRYYMPEAMAPQGLEFLASSVENFVTTLDHNLNEKDPKNKLFERTVYTDEGISPDDLLRFKTFSGKKSQLLLEEIDNWISQLETPNESAQSNLKTGFGIYHYIHDESKKR